MGGNYIYGDGVEVDGLNQTSEKYDKTIRAEIDKLFDSQWKEILPAVIKYAAARAKKYEWLGYDVEPRELIQQAIALAYGVGEKGGYRNWNKSEYPTLGEFLISIIDSITSHANEHAKTFVQETLTYQDGSDRKFVATPVTECSINKSNFASLEDKIIENDKSKKIIEKLKSIACDDEQMGMLILCYEEGISKRSELAAETGYDVLVIDKTIKRLQYQIKKHENEFKALMG